MKNQNKKTAEKKQTENYSPTRVKSSIYRRIKSIAESEERSIETVLNRFLSQQLHVYEIQNNTQIKL